ncbi:Hypothetical predicted protein [Podarcis lilfordi]|uniref:Secreted protein n=1 Tax=Podarcis lilfordi TaxID=74358 RepID=A0AA35K9X3_9SAUR|nr:Hypothetical predicted protein [Podarcis lilfordi]
MRMHVNSSLHAAVTLAQILVTPSWFLEARLSLPVMCTAPSTSIALSWIQECFCDLRGASISFWCAPSTNQLSILSEQMRWDSKHVLT